VQSHTPALCSTLVSQVACSWTASRNTLTFFQVLLFILESLGGLTHCLPTSSFAILTLQEMNSGIKSKQCEQPAGSSNALLFHTIISPPHLQRLLLKLFPFLGICEKQVILKPLHILFLFRVLALIGKGQQPENGLNSFHWKEEQMQT